MTVRWRTVAVGAAVVAGLLQMAVGDKEALAFGALLVLAAAVLQWKGWFVARLAVAGLSLNVLVWMVPALASNLAHRDDLSAVLRPALLVAAGVLAIVAVVLDGRPPSRAPALGAVAAVLAVPVVLVGARVLGVGEEVVRQPGDLEVTMRNTEFDPADVRADAGGGVVITNDDLFWHTWTIDELDIDVRIPTGGTRRVELPLVEPGTYEIVCTIPGHESVGMTGELTLR